MFFKFTSSLPLTVYTVLWYSSGQVLRKPTFLPWELRQDQPITASWGGKIIYPTFKKPNYFPSHIPIIFSFPQRTTQDHFTLVLSLSTENEGLKQSKKKRGRHTKREQWRKKKEQLTGEGKKRDRVGLLDVVVSTNPANIPKVNFAATKWPFGFMKWSEARLFICTAESWWEIVPCQKQRMGVMVLKYVWKTQA